MKHLLKTIYATLLTSVMLTSCASEEIPELPSDRPKYSRIVLSVDMPGLSGDASTRAGFDNFDNEDDKWGKQGENIECLRVMILDSGGNVEVNTLYSDMSDVTHAGAYEYMVLNNDTKTVVLLANEQGFVVDDAGNQVSVTEWFGALDVNSYVDLDRLKALVLKMKENAESETEAMSLRKPLPISAIHTEHIATNDDNEVVEREYVMHRAAVKYSFRIINTSRFDHKLEGIRISRVADKEYLFPNATYETNSLGHQVIDEYFTPEGTLESEYSYTGLSLSLPKQMDEAVQAMAPIYVPEGLVGTAPHKVSITLNGAPLAIWGELKWRMPGQSEAVAKPMTDLPRNTHVVVNITIKDDNTFDFIADVQPYSSVKLDPYYGLERDPDGNIIVQRYPDGSYDIIENGEIVNKDADGDEILKRFSDGSLYCVEKVLKDYIHDTNEVDYLYYFEKDYSGGNMIIIRQKSAGGTYHEEGNLPDHDHDMTDRALFVLDKEGNFKYVTYNADGSAVYSDRDSRGDLILQANGYQFRNVGYMSKYIGTYVVQLSNGEEELRYYIDGRTLDFETGTEGIGVTRSTRKIDPVRRKAILASMRHANNSIGYLKNYTAN